MPLSRGEGSAALAEEIKKAQARREARKKTEGAEKIIELNPSDLVEEPPTFVTNEEGIEEPYPEAEGVFTAQNPMREAGKISLSDSTIEALKKNETRKEEAIADLKKKIEKMGSPPDDGNDGVEDAA